MVAGKQKNKNLWQRADVAKGVKIRIGNVSIAFNSDGRLVGFIDHTIADGDDCLPSTLSRIERDSQNNQISFVFATQN